MNRTLALLLVSAMLVFTLTACGEDTRDDGVNGSNPPAADNNTGNGGVDNGTAGTPGDNGTAGTPGDNSTVTPGGNNNGTTGGNNNGITGDNALTGDGRGDGLTGENGTATKQSSPFRGASYGQMLRNARVHDADGDLTDRENAVTPGATSFY